MVKNQINLTSMRISVRRFNAEAARKQRSPCSKYGAQVGCVDAQPGVVPQVDVISMDQGRERKEVANWLGTENLPDLSIDSKALNQLFEAFRLKSEQFRAHEKRPVTHNCKLSSRFINAERGQPLGEALKNSMEPDFELTVEDGALVKCHLAVLESMCSFFDISPQWGPVRRLTLQADRSILYRLVRFLYTGTIEIGLETLEVFMNLGDFLACEGLLKTCVEFFTQHAIPTEVFLRVHTKFSHVSGVAEILIRNLRRLPVDITEGKNQDTLALLSTSQMKTLLASDDLQVRGEHEAVNFLISWIKVRNPTSQDIRECLKFIRQPFIATAFAESLSTSFPLEKNFLTFSARTHRAKPCDDHNFKSRTSFDRHIHLLWRGPKQNPGGEVDLTITCARWTAANELIGESTLLTQREKPFHAEDPGSIEYAIVEDSIIRFNYNKSRSKIFIANLNLASRRMELKKVIRTYLVRCVDLPDFVVPKNFPSCAVIHFNSGELKPEMERFNIASWQQEEALDMSSMPCHPKEFEVSKDCAFFISCKSVFILNTQCKEATEIHTPELEGVLVDFVRIGDHLFVLEDVSLQGILNFRKNDRIHHIRISTRKYETYGICDYGDEHGPREPFRDDPLKTRKFLRIDSSLYILAQENNTAMLRIFHYDFNRRCTKFVTSLKPPNSDSSQYPLKTRAFIGEFPISMSPCNYTQLQHH